MPQDADRSNPMTAESAGRSARIAGIAANHALGLRQAEHDNHVIAQNVVDEELGRFGGSQWAYELDDDQRDRLLTHARQDASHALANTISLLQAVRRLTRLCIVSLLLVVGMFAFLLFR